MEERGLTDCLMAHNTLLCILAMQVCKHLLQQLDAGLMPIPSYPMQPYAMHPGGMAPMQGPPMGPGAAYMGPGQGPMPAGAMGAPYMPVPGGPMGPPQSLRGAGMIEPVGIAVTIKGATASRVSLVYV